MTCVHQVKAQRPLCSGQAPAKWGALSFLSEMKIWSALAGDGKLWRIHGGDVASLREHKGTSAGYKSTFAYEKLIQMYCQMVVNPKDYFVFGGDFRISLAEGLLNIDDMTATQADSTYDDSSFEREFASRWSGTADGAFFDPEVFDKWRLLEEADQRYDGRTKNGYYIMGVDVGRIACTTEAVIMKVVPSADTRVPRKEVVNIFSFEEEHFGLQSIQLKRLFNRYKCKACVLDGNGLTC